VRFAGFRQDRAALSLPRKLSSDAGGVRRLEQGPADGLINAYNAYMVEKFSRDTPGIRSVWDFGKVMANLQGPVLHAPGGASSLTRSSTKNLRKPGVYDEPRGISSAARPSAARC
jgi:hypothetical protein